MDDPDQRSRGDGAQRRVSTPAGGRASEPGGAGGGWLATLQLVAAIVAGIVAWLVAPGDLETPERHKEFVDFFAASATVIAALLVALAVEARHVTRRKFLANATALCVAVGEVSAIAALSPDLHKGMYRWLFTLTVGGGVGGLVAALVIGAQTLAREVDEARLEELEKLAQRMREDAKSDARAAAGPTDGA